MEAFEGTIKADEVTLVVIKTLRLPRTVECHLLYRRGWFHEHVWAGKVAKRSGKVPPMSQQLLLEPFFGKKMPAMA